MTWFVVIIVSVMIAAVLMGVVVLCVEYFMRDS